MSEKLIITYDEYKSAVEKLALEIEGRYTPTVLVGIMRGAAPIIDILSRIFKIPTAYVVIQSYSGDTVQNQQGELIFSRELSSTVQNMSGNILLCDDLSDTGVTLTRSIEWLKNYKQLKNKIKSIKTAVLWKKADSTFEPDYCAQRLNDNPWIVQPFEKYEEIRIEDLKKLHS